MAEKRNSTKEEMQHKHMERKRAGLEMPKGSSFDRCIFNFYSFEQFEFAFYRKKYIAKRVRVEQLVHV
jgi:hypothetical protein